MWAGPLQALTRASRFRLLLLVGTACAVCVFLGMRAQRLNNYDAYVFAVLAHGAIYCLGVWAVVTVRLGARALWLILIAAALFRLIAFQVPVGLTTDGYRYVWDGRLQAAGVNPYLTVPADPRLVHLRDEAIYPNINGRETYPTIYPPLAQVSFLIGTRFHETIEGFKGFITLVEAGLIAALIGWLRALKLPAERVLIYAWHPLPLWEYTGMGHVDAVAALCIVLGLLAASHRRSGLAGAAFAGAFLVKYWPAYLAAAVWRRFDLRFLGGGVICVLLLATPYLWPEIIGFGFPAVEPAKLIGSFFTHMNDEGYNAEGWGFFLNYAPKHFGWWVVDGRTYAKAAIACLLLFAAAIVFRPAPESVRPAHLVAMITAFLLVLSPHYPWYYALAVPLLTACLWLPLLWVTLVITAIYLEIGYAWLTPYPRFNVYLIAYGGVLTLAVLVAWVTRRRHPRR